MAAIAHRSPLPPQQALGAGIGAPPPPLTPWTEDVVRWVVHA
eukprot:CAMPEP_0182572412 /NCGR_PEP_ID=MMETSP1324-20130603/16420_1 /TAXON_ID=236786 /ORGANISM="Florenciella sp., Strain RCC1587" /LENGTH=41 /DNA_ID= /DNA_START= /DNA_END= /DNA_ORIENTATION=